MQVVCVKGAVGHVPFLRSTWRTSATDTSRRSAGQSGSTRLSSPGNLQQHTHTHTHTRLTALFPGLPRLAGTGKVKPIWILLKQETVSGSGISWAVCKSAPRSRQKPRQHPTTQFFTGRMPFLPPNQQRQSIEGIGKPAATTCDIHSVNWRRRIYGHDTTANLWVKHSIICGVKERRISVLFKWNEINWFNKAYLSDITVTSISQSFNQKMAAKTSWHRYGTKWRRWSLSWRRKIRQMLFKTPIFSRDSIARLHKAWQDR